MNKFDILSIALKNIKKNKSKFALVIISIFIGISSVTIISSIGDLATETIQRELDSMGIDGITIVDTSSEQILNDDVVINISNNFNVDVVMPIINTFSSFTNNRISGNAVIWGVNTDISNLLNLNFLAGQNFSNDDIRSSNNVAIIDENLAYQLYQRTNIVGKYITIILDNTRLELEIIGVISDQKALVDSFLGESSPSFIYTPISTLSTAINQVNYDQIAIRSSDNLNSLLDDLKYFFERQSEFEGKLNIQNISSYMDVISNITLYISLLLTVIAGISMIVASIGVINIMLASTMERKREIGVYLALGAKKKDVGMIFLFESILICFIGGIVGAFIGVIVLLIAFNAINVSYSINYTIILYMIIISLLSGVVAGIFPCIKACKLNPIEVLKDQ